MNIPEIESTRRLLEGERKQKSEWIGRVGQARNQSVTLSWRMDKEWCPVDGGRV